MSGVQIGTSVTIVNSLNGFQAISLSNMTTSAESIIPAGSKLEIAGGFFTFPSDTTPGATSWTAVTTANTAYIACTPAGSAGNQTLTVDYTQADPVWRDGLQGWYASAASLTRYVGGVAKSGTSSYESAFIMSTTQRGLILNTYAIGDWNMQPTANSVVQIPHNRGTTFPSRMRSVSAWIIPDADAGLGNMRIELSFTNEDGAVSGGVALVFQDNIELYRSKTGTFVSVTYDDTGFNRGFIEVLSTGD